MGMDILSNPFKINLKRHWRRRQYRRLDGTTPKRKKVMITRFGGGGGGQRRRWRIKPVPRLRLKMGSPARLWSKLKDAYVNMMLRFAGNVSGLNGGGGRGVVVGGGDAFSGRRISKARPAPVACYSKDEFESRLVFEIFKSLMASKELGTALT